MTTIQTLLYFGWVALALAALTMAVAALIQRLKILPELRKIREDLGAIYREIEEARNQPKE